MSSLIRKIQKRRMDRFGRELGSKLGLRPIELKKENK